MNFNLTNYQNLFTGLVTLCLFILLIYFKINTSSVGMFCTYVPIGCKSNDLLFEPRPIRSDEWLVGAPYFISQSTGGFQTYSNLVGDNQFSSLITAGAYSHWSVVFKPASLGQFLLDVERSYSFYQLFNIFLFVIIVYLIFYRMGIERKYSILLSLILLFTPFIQWWSSFSSVAYPLTLLMLFMIYVKETVFTFWRMLVYLLLFIYIISINIYQLYPPFQISLMLLVSAMCLALIIDQFKFLQKRHLVLIIGVPFLALLFSVTLFYRYSIDFSEAFSAIQNSSYPGNRISAGGDFPKFKFLSGFYDMQLLNDAKPMGHFNQSEAAGFFNIIFFIIPLLIISEVISRLKHKKNDWLVIMLLVYLFFMIGWMFFGYPEWLAKITLLERVPAKRAEIGFGVGGLILLIYSVYVYKYQALIKYIKPVVAVFGFVVVFYVGLYLRDTFPMYISNIYKIGLISLSAGTIIWSAIYQKKLLFAVLFLIFSVISTGSVHPWRLGLQPVTDSEFIRQAKIINNESPGRWAVYNNWVLSSLLYSNNIKAATGTFLYPQDKWWSKIDSNNDSRSIWNRYAHVYFTIPNTSLTSYDAQQQASGAIDLLHLDSFTVRTNPCDEIISLLDIQYLVSTEPLSGTCLSEIDKSNFVHQIYIYKILD